jgi:hypothetical protein
MISLKKLNSKHLQRNSPQETSSRFLSFSNSDSTYHSTLLFITKKMVVESYIIMYSFTWIYMLITWIVCPFTHVNCYLKKPYSVREQVRVNQ